MLIKLADTGPASAAFYRCLLALPLLAVLAVLEQRRRGPRPLRARLGAVLAGLFLAIDLVLWNHAIADVGAGHRHACSATCRSSFVAVAAWVLFRERPERGFFLALPVVLAGVVLVSGLADAAPTGCTRVAGIEYGLGTSLAYAAFLLILRQSSAGTPHVAGAARRGDAGRRGRCGSARPGVRRAGSSTSAGPLSAGCCCWP